MQYSTALQPASGVAWAVNAAGQATGDSKVARNCFRDVGVVLELEEREHGQDPRERKGVSKNAEWSDHVFIREEKTG